MAIIQEIDIQLMLHRLRPGSEYHWKVNSDLGHTLADAVGEWRDNNTQPPTEAELLAAWDAYVIERAALLAQKQADQNDLDGVKPAVIQNALDQIETDLAALPAASLAETKIIIGRILQRQRAIIKALRHLVE